MKNLIITLLLLIPVLSKAQDDDLYFIPEKPVTRTVDKAKTNSENHEIIDYHSSSRNEDEYNRMYSFSGDDQNAGSADTVNVEEDNFEDKDDYEYSRRILRFRSPRIGMIVSSPLYWDMVYTYGAYDYIYDTYYDPFYWGYGWGYAWSWGPWHSWYGPIWGWSPPHHWYHWGCGPLWSSHLGHHHFTPYKHYKRGTFTNRHGLGERIRTGVNNNRISSHGRDMLASSNPNSNTQNRIRSSSRNNYRDNNTEGTYSRYQRSRSGENTYRGQSETNSKRSSTYTRPSSSRYRGTNNTSGQTQNRESTTSRSSSRTSTRSTSSSQERRSTTTGRSSFGSGNSRSSGTFGGGSGRSGGGGSRGGRR